MENTKDIIAAAKKAAGISSDNALALRLGVTRQAVGHWQKGATFDDETAIKIADLIGCPPGELMAICQAQRSKEVSVRSQWLKVAALVAAASLPPAAGASSTLHNENTNDLFSSKSLKGYTLLDV